MKALLRAGFGVRRRPRPAGRCECGSRRLVDVPIHAGRSVRQDCAACGRFVRFSLWYGSAARD